MYRFKRLARILLALALTILGIVVSTPVAQADSALTLRSSEEFDCARYKHFGCFAAFDAMGWATRVTNWKFPNDPSQHNGMADAFRHCIWMGATATRIGKVNAFGIGQIHEDHTPNNPQRERDMDESNNLVGAQIGEDARNMNLTDQWGYVIEQCESKARNYQLFGLGGVYGKSPSN
mgnify:FL=1